MTAPKDEVPWTPGPFAVRVEQDWPFNIVTEDASGSCVFFRHLPCHSTKDRSPAEALACVNFDPSDREKYAAMNRRALADEVLRAESPTMAALLERLLVAMKWRTHSLTEDERVALADAQELVKRLRRGK